MNSSLHEVGPTVVLVEEASEILEAYVLSNLTESTQQLILIGDHLQLRPKVEDFKLSKAARQQFCLDVSLFERLVLARDKDGGRPFSPVTLCVQHRMRPEFSRLARRTYPDLEDHASTQNRPDDLGVARNNNLIFLDHRQDEEAVSDAANDDVKLHRAAR
jgi:superfamily I DNA and/or RNA helicase